MLSKKLLERALRILFHETVAFAVLYFLIVINKFRSACLDDNNEESVRHSAANFLHFDSTCRTYRSLHLVIENLISLGITNMDSNTKIS